MNSHNRFFLNKKILIYGLGKSGISSFHFLKKNNFIYLYDDNKSLLKLKKFNKFLLKKINQNNFDYIVISPGIDINNCDLKNYLKKNQKKIITDFDIFYDCYKKNKIIAITGTNGKSTTAKLLFQVLKKEKKDVRLCGNIGRPILLEKEIKSYNISLTKYLDFFHTMDNDGEFIDPETISRSSNLPIKKRITLVPKIEKDITSSLPELFVDFWKSSKDSLGKLRIEVGRQIKNRKSIKRDLLNDKLASYLR